jgi:hemerythrin-like domain-containing protein
MEAEIMKIDESMQRRRFLQVAGAAGLGLSLPLAAQKKTEAQPEEDVSPPEDLMREHGLLNRVLLIYDESLRHLGKPAFHPDALKNAANIIRTFIEQYHEKLEEDHIFPRFEKARTLVPLVTTLRVQHIAGRRLTEKIIALSGANLKAPDQQSLREALEGFIRMYRPHEAREDTVLFPELRKIVSDHEFDAMGEDFERKEHEMFGKEGFEGMVEKVAAIEKALGIYELSAFTPKPGG